MRSLLVLRTGSVQLHNSPALRKVSDPAMGAHNLALTLLLLALFTLTSIILFEFSTRPPVYVRQTHEVFIKFSSDYQLHWYDEDDFDPNLRHPESSLSGASSRSYRVVNSQERARGRSNVIPSRVSGATQSESAFIMSPVPPLWISNLNSRTETSKEMHIDDNKRYRAEDATNSEIVEPSQPDGPPGMLISDVPLDKASTNQNLVQRMKKIRPPVQRMRVPYRLPKLQVDPSLQNTHKYTNRNITSAAGYKKHINHPPGARRLGLLCTDHHCTSYLLDEDYWSFKICEQWTEKKTKVSHLNITATCRFMKGVTRQPVGLVSLPGSGNTWVRELLEAATGICTGSIYCDHPLRNAGMIGEYVKTGRVLVVKTHTSDHQWNEAILKERNEDDALYDSAILLIRNPFSALIAEWNRLNSFSKYSGYPIGPKKPIAKVNNQNRKMPFKKNKQLQRLFDSGIIKKSLRSNILSRGNYSWTDIVQKKTMQRSYNGGQYGHVLQVGRKLLSTELRNKTDDSHTFIVDKEMFGEYNNNIHAWQLSIVSHYKI